MNVLVILIPASLLLGGVGLAGFLWLLRRNQYDDPEGQATRVLSGRYDDHPAPDPTPARSTASDRPDTGSR
ncbi:MAG: cbb3-type cytochrome oxidase assembly protein CcoS [Amaricoccus sp.]|nr:cbb3-type cytochrome oxidase assembly protein CcoS [Amaricoccus sp.]